MVGMIRAQCCYLSEISWYNFGHNAECYATHQPGLRKVYPVWPNWNLRLDRGTQYTFSRSILVHGRILAHLNSMSPRYSDYLATLQKEDTTALTSNGPLHFSSSCPPPSLPVPPCLFCVLRRIDMEGPPFFDRNNSWPTHIN